MKNVLSKLGGYTVSVITTAAVSLLVIPLVIRLSGDAGWASFAVGQSAGSIAGVLIALGWGVSGPTLIAGATPEERVGLARAALLSRLIATPPILLVTVIVAVVLAPTEPFAAALSCVATSTVGLGFTWVFVGGGKPGLLFFLDTLPRALGTVFGGLLFLLTRELWNLAAIQLIGGIVSITISARHSARPRERIEGHEWSVRTALGHTRGQMYASITAITASIYLALPTLVIASIAPQATGAYALADRLGRFSLLALTPFSQWLQGWVPRRDGDRLARHRRIRLASLSAGSVGVVTGVGVALLGPFVAHLLGGGNVVVGFALTVPIGVTVLMSTVSRCTGMACLQALGRYKDVAASAILGAIVGLPLLVVLVPVLSAPGAALAVTIAETSVTIFQVFRLRRALRADTGNV